ncbi:DUF6011 domain-containing protein [Anoxybacteroides tepidamans]|uniref:DUF6011 domain-containing protein n=1 Tax=Anoxybacteroides tepidamans TaxID=265948 RepID=UPI000558321C|nr:DUF6011 domain-containing protein [Anoxybacillus tepidamans]
MNKRVKPLNCPVCNRQLKSQKSIERGMGPVCAIKLLEKENEPPKGQMSIDEYLQEGDEVDMWSS